MLGLRGTHALGAETQDLGIRDLPDAHAQLIEMQLHLEEVSSNVEVLQEKVRARPCCSQQCLIWRGPDSAMGNAVLRMSRVYHGPLCSVQLERSVLMYTSKQLIMTRLRLVC